MADHVFLNRKDGNSIAYYRMFLVSEPENGHRRHDIIYWASIETLFPSFANGSEIFWVRHLRKRPSS